MFLSCGIGLKGSVAKLAAENEVPEQKEITVLITSRESSELQRVIHKHYKFSAYTYIELTKPQLQSIVQKSLKRHIWIMQFLL